MKYSCLHTHTNFCDGNADVESFCQKAWEKGLDSLGFSSHAPIVKKTGFPPNSWNMREDHLENYIETVNAAKRRWEGRLKIFLGLEIDYINGLMGPNDKDYIEMGLDYIIGAVHYVLPPHGEPFTVDASQEEVEKGIRDGYGGDPLAMVEAYWDAQEGLIRGGGFDILAHVDVIKKNNSQNRFFSEDSEVYKQNTKKISDLAGENNIIIELNTGGMIRKKTASPYPSLPFLKLFREKNVPALITADAHNPDDLTGHYIEGRQTLLEAGYKNTVLLDGRIDGRNLWKEEIL